MSRPPSCRKIAGLPRCVLFKPAGVPRSSLEETVLGVDELEALRLADLEGLYHEEAAERMNVSRATFGRIVESARRKVALALSQGRALRITGGRVEVIPMREFECYDCRHAWALPHGTGRPQKCPECGSVNIHRVAGDRGWARGGPGCGRGRGRCFRGGAGRRRAASTRDTAAPGAGEEKQKGKSP